MRNPKTGRMESKYHVGQKVGRLTLLRDTGKRSHGYYIWECDCSCGKTINQATYQIRGKKIASCGCSSDYGRHRKYFCPAFNTLWHQHKNRLNAKNLSFSLTRDELHQLTKSNCAYCGAKPSQIAGTTSGPQTYIYNGVDRVDNSKGYVFDNCVPCCKVCNRAKWDMTLEQFKEWIERIKTHAPTP